MRVRLLTDLSTMYGSWESGYVLECDEAQALAFIALGVAEAADASVVPEAAVLPEAPERAVLPRARHR